MYDTVGAPTESISGAPRDSPAEQEAYDQLRAHAHYQKPAGKDYLFWHHRNEKRSREVGVAPYRPRGYGDFRYGRGINQ